tara:strand:+ start:55 stop:468 length:414 start_codon:yes stop_codon:yes gene_type:complete
MGKKEKIIVYTNKTCPFCKQIVEHFDEIGIKFENRLTEDNQKEWGDVVNLTNMPTVPTVYYKNNYFIPQRDFQSKEQLAQILEHFEESKASLSKQNFEKLKTLNFHISQAFINLDKRLQDINNNLQKEKEDEHKSTD